MLLKLILFLACYVSFVTAQAIPSVYSSVALFDCFNPNSLELIRINTMCGTLLSPCYPDNYTVEVDAGKKLWDIQYIPPTGRTVAGYRLNFIDFVTNDFGGDGGIIYIGQTISVDSSTNVAEAARDISISGDGRTAPGFLIQRTGVAATNGLIGHVLDLDYPRWYTNFYSSLQPARRGFNITYCGELNLCDAAANYCKNGGTCSRASFGVYSCACTASFMGPTCEIDVDECLTNPCHSLATCTNTVGTFICTCNAGYTGDGLAAGTCANINECTLPSHNCHANAVCTDTIGSFTCACNTGYTGNGVTCTDINECTQGTHTCHINADCTNTLGSFTCACKALFTGDGTTCTARNECTDGGNNCHANAACTDTSVAPGFTCACNIGYAGDGVTCTNINECTLPSHNCHANAACTDTIGSFTCACNIGYTGNGVTCTDVDECTVGTHTCHAQATCTNTVGSFTCACNTGFTGNGLTCTNINECTLPSHNCHANAACTDTIGSFTCACNTGYTGNGVTCTDVDECTVGTHTCHAQATCTNTVGSFTCACNTGFTGDGFTCTNINECTTGAHNCDVNADCTDTPGSFTCQCKTGYTGNGNSCVDIDECTLGTDNCHASATCTNTVGSYTCMCNAGFTGDGFTCIDIDECALGLHNCNTSLNEQVCSNTMGGFNCLCNSPEYRGTPPSCLGYYCPGNVSLPATCLIPGFIEWPLFHDGSKIFNNNEEVTWFVNMTGQVNKTAIRFIFQEISVAHTQDYIIFSTSPDINDLSAFLAVITGTKTNILNQLTAASSTNPVGFDVATSTYIIPRTEVYIHFHSDREIVSTGFKIRYDPDTDDCVTSSVNCKNNGTCSDRVFDYMCENCPGYTGRDCDMDEDECSNSTLNNCHANSTCTNLNGTFSCACNAPSFTGNGTFCQPHLNVTNLVVSSPPGGTSLNITFDTTAPWGTDPNYLNNYNILLFKVGETRPTNITTASVNLPAFQSTVVSGLLPATSYYVQITAGARGPLFPTAVFEINVANITYQTADTVPLAPSNLNVTSSDQDTVRIEWTRPNETSIGKTIEYIVEAQRSVQDCITFGVPALGFQVDCALPKDFTVSASAVMSNTYVLTGLVPYRTYNIRIRAKTSAGSGPWSNNATAFTGIECPGFRRPVPASQPSCTFQEASIRSENFPRQYPPWNDTFYSVDFRGQGAVQIVFDFFATEPNQDYLDIIFGTINFAPQIPNSRIRNSFTGDITGSQSPIVFTMAETGGILTLRFHADLFNPTGNGSFPGFQVHYETNSTRCSPNPCINGGTCTDIPFDFQCACPTIWGGKVCNLQLVSIDVQCSSTSPTSFTVNWNVTSAWQNDATVIAGYNVTYSGAVTGFMRKALGDSSATVSGFTGYQPYTVTVTILAVSPATVPTSNTCSGNTAQQAPDAPTSVVATATSSSTIDVTWVAPVVTRGVVSSYTVTYTQTENGVSMRQIVVAPATTFTIFSLPAYRTYTVSVLATTAGGNGPIGNAAATARTFEAVPGPVSGLTLTPTARTIAVAFTAPISTGVMNYDVEYFVTTATAATATTISTANPSVTIPTLTPATGYTVNVYARSGIPGRSPVQTATTTTAEDVPSAVTGLSVSSTDPSMMLVMWGVPAQQNGVITGYRVTWSPGAGSQVVTGATSHTITGLSAFTDYTVTVYASTAVGEGPGDTATGKTAEGVPTTAVTGLQVVPSARSAAVTFNAPVPVTGVFVYTVQYYVTSAGVGTAQSVTLNTNSGTVPALTPNSAYTFVVTPRTGATGAGPTATATHTTLEDTPGMVSSLVVSSSRFDQIDVTWGAPTMPNGVITQYQITWSPGNGMMNFSSTTTTHSITPLTSNLDYTVTVYAYTAIGRGVSNSAVQRTLESVPIDPVTSVVIATGATSVNVSFNQPATVTGMLSYEVKYYVTSAGPSTAVEQNFTSTADTITGLMPNTAYTVIVTPQTTAGKGGAATVVTQTFMTDEAAAAAVASVTEGTKTADSITVDWAPPAVNNGVITQYRVTWNSGAGNQVVTSGTSHTITGLSAFTDYTVTVYASTAVGEGPGVNQVIRTNEAVPTDPVTSVNVVPQATSVGVSFNQPATVTGMLSYEVRYYVTSAGTSTAVEQNFTSTTDTITGLMPNTAYTVIVTPQTSAGKGGAATATTQTFTTLEDVAAAVASVTEGTKTADSITVNWAPPAVNNGVITQYRVTWSPGAGSQVVTGATSHTITGLSAFTDYTVTVYASTAVGEGPGVNQVIQTNEAVPAQIGAFVAVGRTNTIRVTITPPVPANGVLLRYEATLNQDQAECTRFGDTSCTQNRVQSVAANGNTPGVIVFGNLTSFRSYEITVRASTSAGFGPVSVILTSRTTSIAPQGVPTNVQITSLSDTSAIVTWDSAKPVPGNSTYIVTLTAVSNSSDVRTITIIPSTVSLNNSVVFTNLQAGHGYSGSVVQSTSVGMSDPSTSATLYRAPTLIAGAAPPTAGPTTNALGVSPTVAFQVENPCLRKAQLFSEIGGTINQIQLIVWQIQAPTPTTNANVWANVINQNPIVAYQAGTITCTGTASGRKKRALTANNDGYVVGADSTCTTTTVAVCNGPLPSGRQFNVSYIGVNGGGQTSGMTAPGGPFSTSTPTGLEAGEIAAIVISCIVVLLLIISLIYYCVKRRRASGMHTVSGRDNRSFDDTQKQRYQVEASETPSTTYSTTQKKGEI